MSTASATSDEQILDLLRTSGPLGVAELTKLTGVTATAVRQRLGRLQGQELIEREVDRGARGRPRHRYLLTDKARRLAGSNYQDLAHVLWDEIRAVENPEIRRGLYKRLAKSMAARFAGEMTGDTVQERMAAFKDLLKERRVTFEVESDGQLPVLKAVDCPYPELADKDRGICAVEKMMLEELLEEDVRLSQCRFDGHACCRFEPSGALL